MSEEEKKTGRLVGLQTDRAKDAEFIVQLAEDFLRRAKEGTVKQVAIIWNDYNDGIMASKFSSNKWTLYGMIQQALHDMLASRL